MAGSDYLLKIDTIDGESTQKGHEKWIELNSWSWGVSQTNIGSQSSGAGAGKVSISSFNIMKRVDSASPPLFLRCAQDQRITTATLSFTHTNSDGNEVEYYKITLSNVMVSSIQGGTPPPPAPGATAGGDERPTESLSLNFQKIRFDYTPIDATGQAGPPVTATATVR